MRNVASHDTCADNTGSARGISMTGTYNGWLVLLSVMDAITSSYVSLDMTSRVTADSGHKIWNRLGDVSMFMVLGSWSMHLFGMLAFRLQVALYYDVAITLLSFL